MVHRTLWFIFKDKIDVIEIQEVHLIKEGKIEWTLEIHCEQYKTCSLKWLFVS